MDFVGSFYVKMSIFFQSEIMSVPQSPGVFSLSNKNHPYPASRRSAPGQPRPANTSSAKSPPQPDSWHVMVTASMRKIYENLGVLRKNQRFFAPKNWGTCCFQKNLDVFWGNEVLLLMILSAVQKTKAAIGMLTSCGTAADILTDRWLSLQQ